jgi:outer membrane protein OmpA-like peptidoglycan-associated protein
MITISRQSVLAMSAVVLVAGCTDPRALDPSDPNRNTRTGAIAGAAIGTGLAAITGAEGAQLLVGAVAGGLAGGLAGSELDRQAAELRAQLANDGITVRNAGDRLTVTLPQDLTFETGSAKVLPSLEADILQVAGYLQRLPTSTVQVIGHTDSTGDATFNLGLSQERANAVASVLLAGGVAGNRIQAIGQGEAQPVATNLTPEGRAQNRRVEIVILPPG